MDNRHDDEAPFTRDNLNTGLIGAVNRSTVTSRKIYRQIPFRETNILTLIVNKPLFVSSGVSSEESPGIRWWNEQGWNRGFPVGFAPHSAEEYSLTRCSYWNDVPTIRRQIEILTEDKWKTWRSRKRLNRFSIRISKEENPGGELDVILKKKEEERITKKKGGKRR